MTAIVPCSYFTIWLAVCPPKVSKFLSKVNLNSVEAEE